MKKTEQKVLNWASDKGILAPNNIANQALKLASEAGEVCDAVLKKDINEIDNEIGDVLVVCTIIANQNGSDLETCLKKALNKINNRKGKTVGGTFIKE